MEFKRDEDKLNKMKEAMRNNNTYQLKTDSDSKNDFLKKINVDSVIQQWEFKAKGKYQSKFLEAYTNYKFKVRK